MFIKNIHIFILLMVVPFGLVSCEELAELLADRITLANDANRQVHFSGDGGTRSILLKATSTWSAVSDQEWCTPTPSEGLSTDIQLTIDVEASTSDEPRSATVTLTSGNASLVINVTQDERMFLSVEDADFVVRSEGGIVEVKVEHNVAYEVNIPRKAKWITDLVSKSVSESVHRFQVEANEDMDNRSAVITFVSEDGEHEEEIELVQLRKEALVVSDRNYILNAAAGILSFDVLSSDPLEVQIQDAAWISRVESRAVETTLEFAYEANTQPVSRKARIKLMSGSAADYIEIEQKPAPEKLSFTVGHEAATFTVPQFWGTFTGTVFWGDGRSEAFDKASLHNYSSSGENTVKFELYGQPEELKFRFPDIVGITSLDLSSLPID